MIMKERNGKWLVNNGLKKNLGKRKRTNKNQGLDGFWKVTKTPIFFIQLFEGKIGRIY